MRTTELEVLLLVVFCDGGSHPASLHEPLIAHLTSALKLSESCILWHHILFAAHIIYTIHAYSHAKWKLKQPFAYLMIVPRRTILNIEGSPACAAKESSSTAAGYWVSAAGDTAPARPVSGRLRQVRGALGGSCACVVYILTRIYIYISRERDIHIYIHISIHMYIHMYTYTYIDIHIHICKNTHIHICIYTHTCLLIWL